MLAIPPLPSTSTSSKQSPSLFRRPSDHSQLCSCEMCDTEMDVIPPSRNQISLNSLNLAMKKTDQSNSSKSHSQNLGGGGEACGAGGSVGSTRSSSSLLSVPKDTGKSRSTSNENDHHDTQDTTNTGFSINIIEANKSKPNTYHSPGSPIPRPNPLEGTGNINQYLTSSTSNTLKHSNSVTSKSSNTSSSSSSNFKIPLLNLPLLKLTPPDQPMRKTEGIPEQNLGKNSLYVPLKTEELGWEEGGIYWAGRYSYPIVNLYGGDDDHVVGQYRGGPEGYAFTDLWEPELWEEEVEESDEAKLAAACALIKQKAEEARAKKAKKAEEDAARIKAGLKPLPKEKKKVENENTYSYEDMVREMEIDEVKVEDQKKIESEASKGIDTEMMANDKAGATSSSGSSTSSSVTSSEIGTPPTTHPAVFTRRNSNETDNSSNCTTPLDGGTPRNERSNPFELELELARKFDKTTEQDSEGNTPTNGLLLKSQEDERPSKKEEVNGLVESGSVESKKEEFERKQSERIGNQIMNALVDLKRKEEEGDDAEKDSDSSGLPPSKKKVQRSNSNPSSTMEPFNIDSTMIPTNIQPGSHAALALDTLLTKNPDLDNGLATAPLPIMNEMSGEEAFPFFTLPTNNFENYAIDGLEMGSFDVKMKHGGEVDEDDEDGSGSNTPNGFQSKSRRGSSSNQGQEINLNGSFISPNGPSPSLTRRATFDDLASLSEPERVPLHKRAAARRPRPSMLIRNRSEQIMNGDPLKSLGMRERTVSYGFQA